MSFHSTASTSAPDEEISSSFPAHERVAEQERLDALDRYDILDTEAEEAFDHVTELAADLFDVPIAAVSLIDRDRQWFKSCVGVDADEMSLDNSFCARSIHTTGVTVVEDARTLEPYASMPGVDCEDGFRFYAGAPLTTSDGHALGTLCVLDRKPRRRPDERKLRHLRNLAGLVVDEMELRFETRRRARQTQSLRQEAQRAEVARATAEHARMAAEEAQKKAEEASASKSRFLTGIAHDIRSPISAIDGYAHLLARQVDHSGSTYASRILQATRHLSEMADSLSELAELETGAIHLHVERQDVVPILREVVDALSPRADAAGITLQAHLPEDRVPVSVNARALRRVVDNLIGNAIKYASKNDRVDVHLHPAGHSASSTCIEVADTGPGIDPSFLDIMYEPFTQFDAQAEGSGLGLAVTKELVEAMGARIDATSPGDDGTTFFVMLRTGEAAVNPSSAPSTDAPSGALDPGG